MSYLLNSLQDRAVGYWSFSGTMNDLTSASNTASAYNTASYTNTPLIAIGGSALRVTSTSSVVIGGNSTYTGLSKNTFDKTFSIGFWFNFNNQMIGSGNGVGIYKNNQLNILYVKNIDGTIVAKMYYDYATNSFRFSIPGTSGTNTESYYVVNNYDTSFYIFVNYSNGSSYISVNGEKGHTGVIYDLPDYDYKKYYYVLDGSTSLNADTINSSSATSFIINSLEFFSYELNPRQIKQKFFWAFNDAKPNFQAKINPNTSFFSFMEDPKLRGFSTNISGTNISKNENVIFYNLSTNKKIQPIPINQAIISGSYTISSGSGISFNSGGVVQWSDFGSYINLYKGVTLSAQITRSVFAQEHIFYINGINSNSDLYLEYDATSAGNTQYLLKYKNVSTGSVSVLTSLNTGASATTSSVALSITSSSITLYVNESTSSSAVWTGSSVVSGPSVSLPFNSSRSSNLYIAKYDGSLNFTSKIKNVGITNTLFTAPSFNFSNVYQFMIKLTNSTNPNIVSQYGYYIWQVNSSHYPTQMISGTHIDWNGMDSASVSVKTSAASGYSLLGRGGTASAYDLTLPAKNISIKVEMITDYDPNIYNQSINRIFFSLYKDLNLYSNSIPYILSPIYSNTNNFVIKSYANLDVLARSNNFGIKFNGVYPNNPPQYASITAPSSNNYYGIDFWYRADAINQYSGNTSSTNYILSNVSSSTSDPAIWIDRNRKLNYSSNCILYVNGASVANGSYMIIQDEPYHLFLTSSAALTSNLYLNGYSSGSVNSIATYGHLQFWNNIAVPASTPSARYQSFVSIPLAKVVDNNTTTYTDKLVVAKIGK
jgi:hypothetical protein